MVLTIFSIVVAPSAYNIILGRLALNSFLGVISPYHQKIKFPIGNVVGEVRGDQQAAHKCYVKMTQMDQKKSSI